MNNMPSAGIAYEGWEATLPSVHLLRVAPLGNVRKMYAGLYLTPHKSSTLPSSEPPSAPPDSPKIPRGRKRDRQVGHERTNRTQYVLDEIIVCLLEERPQYHLALPLNLPDTNDEVVTQVWKLSLLRPITTDYHKHSMYCPTNARVTALAQPQACNGYDMCVVPLCNHLHSTHHLSCRIITTLLADVANLPIGVESVVARCGHISAPLDPIDVALHRIIDSPAVVNVNETNWIKCRKRCWLWTTTSTCVMICRVALGRGRTNLYRVLDESYPGIGNIVIPRKELLGQGALPHHEAICQNLPGLSL